MRTVNFWHECQNNALRDAETLNSESQLKCFNSHSEQRKIQKIENEGYHLVMQM